MAEDGGQREAQEEEVEDGHDSVDSDELVRQVKIDHSSSKSDHDDDDGEVGGHHPARVDGHIDMLATHIDICPPLEVGSYSESQKSLYWAVLYNLLADLYLPSLFRPDLYLFRSFYQTFLGLDHHRHTRILALSTRLLLVPIDEGALPDYPSPFSDAHRDLNSNLNLTDGNSEGH